MENEKELYRASWAESRYSKVSEPKVHLRVENRTVLNVFRILIKGRRTHALDRDCTQNG